LTMRTVWAKYDDTSVSSFRNLGIAKRFTSRKI